MRFLNSIRIDNVDWQLAHIVGCGSFNGSPTVFTTCPSAPTIKVTAPIAKTVNTALQTYREAITQVGSGTGAPPGGRTTTTRRTTARRQAAGTTGGGPSSD